jgi:hypothetical protein
MKQTTYIDSRNGGKYVFQWYRTLTREEVVSHMRLYLSSKKNPRATKKTTIVIPLLDDR